MSQRHTAKIVYWFPGWSPTTVINTSLLIVNARPGRKIDRKRALVDGYIPNRLFRIDEDDHLVIDFPPPGPHWIRKICPHSNRHPDSGFHTVELFDNDTLANVLCAVATGRSQVMTVKCFGNDLVAFEAGQAHVAGRIEPGSISDQRDRRRSQPAALPGRELSLLLQIGPVFPEQF